LVRTAERVGVGDFHHSENKAPNDIACLDVKIVFVGPIFPLFHGWKIQSFCPSANVSQRIKDEGVYRLYQSSSLLVEVGISEAKAKL
jgi:hypothetical protein